MYGKTFSEPFFSVIVVFATTSLLKIIHSDLFIARIMEFSPGWHKIPFTSLLEVQKIEAYDAILNC